MPTPRFVTFFFSSSWASSSSSRKSELVCSATWRATAPKPEFFSVSCVCIVAPVDHLRDGDPHCEGDADDEKRARATALAGALSTLGGRLDASVAGLLVGRRRSLRTRPDQARLELAQELGVVGQRLRELGGDPAFCGGLVGHLLELVRGSVHDLIGFRRHFRVGGSSPVATRQIFEAVLRAARVAAAASEA